MNNTDVVIYQESHGYGISLRVLDDKNLPWEKRAPVSYNFTDLPIPMKNTECIQDIESDGSVICNFKSYQSFVTFRVGFSPDPKARNRKLYVTDYLVHHQIPDSYDSEHFVVPGFLVVDQVIVTKRKPPLNQNLRTVT